jgi:glycosyltransferase involved in cell wall biosynthesis
LDLNMKILYLLPTVTHPTMRGELRHYHFLRALSQRHDVSVVALSRTPVTTDALCDLRSSARRVFVTEAAPITGGAGNDRASAGVLALHRRYAKRQRVRRSLEVMRNQLRQLVQSERFDVAVVYSVELQSLVRELRGVPVVADLCDAQSMRIRQSLPFVNPVEGAWRLMSWWHMRLAEQALAARASRVTFISERDLAAVPAAASRAEVVPNGVDATYWSRRATPATTNSLVFTGVMDYGPNADAGTYLTTEILPRVRVGVPDTQLTIAGRNPTPQLRHLAARTGAVEITDYVEDLRPYLERAAVFVAPLRFASGTQNKILEAMAMQLPVVTTQVAADGLRVGSAGAAPVLVADRPDLCARAIRELLRDEGRRRELGALGRAYVKKHFDWDRSAVQLEACCLAASATGCREEAAHDRRVAAHD